jgi:hypothetical protein
MRSRAFVRLAFGLLPAILVNIALAVAAPGGLASAADTSSPLAVTERDGVAYVDARDFGVEGRGWPAADFAAPFDRLPAKAQEKVRADVWNLSRHAAGLCVRFVADTPAIHARWTLTSDSLAMPHMPATGVSGLDLYARDDAGHWRWVACATPNKAGLEQGGVVVDGLAPGKREWLLYLPLYNGVTSLEIGVPAGATLERAPAALRGRDKPIVFYGTSITHGACASRPGTCHTAILHRRYGRPVVNLGFSGNGRMEVEMGELLAEIDAAAYVIDCCPNLDGPTTAARTRPLVELLRKARPDTPILLVEDRRYTDSWLRPAKRAHNDANHAALKAAYDELVAAGVPGLHYLGGDDLLGADGEGTVDSSHPTDSGFVDHAKAFAKVLDPLLR